MIMEDKYKVHYIRRDIQRIARANNLEYTWLISFIRQNRALPEFERVIDDYHLESLIYGRSAIR